MYARGTIYGRFVSKDPGAGSPAPPFTCECPSSPSPRMLSSNHAPLRLKERGKIVCSCRAGCGISLKIAGTDTGIRLDGRTCYLYDLDVLPGHEAALAVLLRHANNEFFKAGFDKMLLCTDTALPPAVLASAGLYEAGSYGRLRPFGLFFSCSLRPACQREHIVSVLKGVFRKLMPSLAFRLSCILSKLRKPYTLFSGRLSDRQVNLLFLGPELLARFYASLVFRSMPPHVITSGTLLDPDPHGLLRSTGADIVAFYCQEHEAPKNMLVLPDYVRSILETQSSFDNYLQTLGKSATSDLRKIEKAGFGCRISHDSLDLAMFYSSMYLPMLANRHGDCAITHSYEEMQEFFRKGFLLFIMKDRAPVGAALAVGYGRRLLLKFLGVLGGSFAHTKAGVNSALNYFGIQHAFDNGYSVLDLGYSGPFLSDGVVWYKKKWKTRLVVDSKPSAVLCLGFRDEKTKELFCSNVRPVTLENERFTPEQ